MRGYPNADQRKGGGVKGGGWRLAKFDKCWEGSRNADLGDGPIIPNILWKSYMDGPNVIASQSAYRIWGILFYIFISEQNCVLPYVVFQKSNQTSFLRLQNMALTLYILGEVLCLQWLKIRLAVTTEAQCQRKIPTREWASVQVPIQRLPCRLRAPSLPSSAFLLSFAIRFKSGNGAANDRASGPCSRSLPLPSLFLLSRPLDRSVDSWVLAMRVGHRDRRRTERHPSLFVHTRGKGSLSAFDSSTLPNRLEGGV